MRDAFQKVALPSLSDVDTVMYSLLYLFVNWKEFLQRIYLILDASPVLFISRGLNALLVAYRLLLTIVLVVLKPY